MWLVELLNPVTTLHQVCFVDSRFPCQFLATFAARTSGVLPLCVGRVLRNVPVFGRRAKRVVSFAGGLGGHILGMLGNFRMGNLQIAAPTTF